QLGVELLAKAQARPKEIKKEGLSEYFLYTIEGKETIAHGFSKRLISFSEDNVPVVNLYKYEQERYGDSVRRFLSFKNDTDHQLGETPIPGGVLKVYRTVDDAEHLTYVGQSEFKYIPVDEDVELDIGAVDDVVVKPTLMDFSTNNYKYEPNGNIIGWDELQTFKIEAKNTRPVPVEIRIQRNFGMSDWELTTEQEYEKVDLDTVKFTLELPPRSRQEFEYVFKTSHEIEYFGPKHVVGWWKFDERSGNTAVDSSGRGSHGNIEGGPNWSADGGRFGGCLVFSDDTAVILPQNVLDPVDKEITISVWLKDPIRPENNNTVFDTGDGDFHLQAAVGGTTTGDDVYFRAGAEGDDAFVWNPPGRSKRLRGWHHYVFIKDEVRDRMLMYFDGSLARSKANVSDCLFSIRNTAFKIGARVQHQNDFVGSVDDFRIYGYVLSDKHIQRLYNRGSGGR
ncbi:MAG: LamG-like jellyroll fold domain-containing protein, partial [Planctomycetota bacterium]